MYDKFFDAVAENRLTLGAHCLSQDITMYEMCGKIGYDFVWIDGEHGALGQDKFTSAIIGTQAGGAAALVRVPGNTTRDVKAILDLGPQGIIFPMINTAEEAETAVKQCLYPPAGNRSFAPLRAMEYYQLSPEEYMDRVQNRTLRLLQCEHYESVKNLDEILEVPGVSGIIIGPLDLSASIGKLGRYNDPEVLELMLTAIKKCKEKKIPFGTCIGYNPDFIKFWIENGISILTVGNAYEYFNAMSKKVMHEVEEWSAGH